MRIFALDAATGKQTLHKYGQNIIEILKKIMYKDNAIVNFFIILYIQKMWMNIKQKLSPLNLKTAINPTNKTWIQCQ